MGAGRGLGSEGAVGGTQFADDLLPFAGAGGRMRVLDASRGHGDGQHWPVHLPRRGHYEGFPRVAGGGLQVGGGPGGREADE